MNKKLIATLVLSSLTASAFAMNAGAATDKQVLKDEKGSIHSIQGNLGKVSGATAEERALNALNNAKGDFGFAKAEGTFKVKSSHKDENGTTHTKMTQTLNNIPVFGAEMIVHETDGNVSGITGSYEAGAPTATAATLKGKDAVGKAVAHTGFTGKLDSAPTTELVYYPINGKSVLAYQVNVHYLSENPGNWDIFVDATNGSIVDAINKIEHAGKPGGGTGGSAAVGSAKGVLNDNKSVNTTNVGGVFYLEDISKYMYTQKGSKIVTKNFNNSTGTQSSFTDSDNVWDSTVQRAGVDAHYYAGVTYDYYYNQLGRNSYDGNGAALLSGVHYYVGYNNAFWDGQQMTYGDGDGVNFRAFSAALDVVAHELTHAVTDTTSGLVYRDQSGALNESWSDAMGSVIEGANWTMGEDITLPAFGYNGIRSMSNPAAYGDPAHMNDYVNTSSDNGGVHTNSGIPNKAFYNFATAINSRNIAGKIWYTASRDYMTRSTNFSGARAATLQAAAALYGSGSSTYTALQNAWSAVGVY